MTDNPKTNGRHLTDESYILERKQGVQDRLASLREREEVCWAMAGVETKVAAISAAGVEIQGIHWVIRELEKICD